MFKYALGAHLGGRGKHTRPLPRNVLPMPLTSSFCLCNWYCAHNWTWMQSWSPCS